MHGGRRTALNRLALLSVAIQAMAAVVWLATRISPRPAVLVIRWVFDRDGRRTAQAFARHVPSGVAARLDVAYDPADPDGRLDVFFPSELEGTTRTLPAVVWVHGGAWVSGSKDHVAGYLQILASRGFATVGVDYSVAPGARYPTPLRQLDAALVFLVSEGARLHVDGSRLVLAGDSAGAQIAAQFANIVTAPAAAAATGVRPTMASDQLRGTLLFCGPFDTRHGAATVSGFGATVLWAYTGSKSVMDDPRFDQLSVAHHVTSAFPPTFLSVGNADPLAPQSRDFADALRAQSVPVDALLFEEDHRPPLGHEYQFDLDSDAGRSALDRSVAFLRRVTAD